MSRACAKCGRAIIACNGGVKAGDMLDWPQQMETPPRELCGLCALAWIWTEDGGLVLQDDLPESVRERALGR